MANLAGFFYNKIRRNAFLSAVLYKDGKYYISNLAEQGSLDGKLLVSLFPKSELTSENIPRLEDQLIAEVDDNTICIFSRVYKPIFLRWIKEFQKETNQEIKLI